MVSATADFTTTRGNWSVQKMTTEIRNTIFRNVNQRIKEVIRVTCWETRKISQIKAIFYLIEFRKKMANDFTECSSHHQDESEPV